MAYRKSHYCDSIWNVTKTALFTTHSSKHAMQADISRREITLLKRRFKHTSTSSSCFCSQIQCSDLCSSDVLGT